jgi:hypothetical protein
MSCSTADSNTYKEREISECVLYMHLFKPPSSVNSYSGCIVFCVNFFTGARDLSVLESIQISVLFNGNQGVKWPRH